MAKISLIAFDSLIPSFALMKLSTFHKNKGDSVVLNGLGGNYDKKYVSCIFSKNKEKVEKIFNNENIDIGGSGYNLEKKLPEEIDKCFPDYSLYPKIDYSIGFTTRGCNRNCKFCIVTKKEGNFKVIGDIYNFYDKSKNKIVLMDNNIFDNINDYEKVENVLSEFKHRKIHSQWYVIVGFNSTMEEDIIRLNLIRKYKQRAYVMRYESCYKSENKKFYNKLANWANRHHVFHKVEFQEMKY